MKLGENQTFASPEEALEHHGVKGMRWGVRKEEETGSRDKARLDVNPSGRATSASTLNLTSRDRLNVEKFIKSSDLMGTKVSELKIKNDASQDSLNPSKLHKKYGDNQTREQFAESQKKAVKDAETVHKGKLTEKQKKVVIGALAVGGILATGAILSGVAKGQQSGALNSYQLLAKARLSGNKVPFKINKELTGPMSAKDLLEKIAKPVNPMYSTPGGQMNCRRSTYTYELRRRGFDVHATTSSMGWGQSESGVINALTTEGDDFFHQMSMSEGVVKTGFSSLAKGDTRVSPVKKILLDDLHVKRPSLKEMQAAIIKNGGSMPEEMNKLVNSKNISSSKKVLEELAKQPNGARGEVVFKFNQFGHSMAYEIVDGVPHIFDSQKGTLYNEATKMVESKWDGFHSAEITRLDNVDLDLNFLTRWSTNNSDKSSGLSVAEAMKKRIKELAGSNSDYDLSLA